MPEAPLRLPSLQRDGQVSPFYARAGRGGGHRTYQSHSPRRAAAPVAAASAPLSARGVKDAAALSASAPAPVAARDGADKHDGSLLLHEDTVRAVYKAHAQHFFVDLKDSFEKEIEALRKRAHRNLGKTSAMELPPGFDDGPFEEQWAAMQHHLAALGTALVETTQRVERQQEELRGLARLVQNELSHAKKSALTPIWKERALQDIAQGELRTVCAEEIQRMCSERALVDDKQLEAALMRVGERTNTLPWETRLRGDLRAELRAELRTEVRYITEALEGASAGSHANFPGTSGALAAGVTDGSANSAAPADASSDSGAPVSTDVGDLAAQLKNMDLFVGELASRFQSEEQGQRAQEKRTVVVKVLPLPDDEESGEEASEAGTGGSVRFRRKATGFVRSTDLPSQEAVADVDDGDCEAGGKGSPRAAAETRKEDTEAAHCVDSQDASVSHRQLRRKPTGFVFNSDIASPDADDEDDDDDKADEPTAAVDESCPGNGDTSLTIRESSVGFDSDAPAPQGAEMSRRSSLSSSAGSKLHKNKVTFDA